MSKLIIYAPNVHSGGGKTLLTSLLDVVDLDNTLLIIDQRLDYKELNSFNVIAKIQSKYFSRFMAERILKKHSKSNDIVLCFHSLPPIFKSKAKVLVYFHNKHLINENFRLLFNEKIQTIIRILLEKFIARFFYKNVDQYFVQSMTMKRILTSYYSKKMSSISVFPFFDHIQPKSNKNKTHVEFIYVSAGPRHKNHATLIDAWVYLANQGISPKLTLTLSNENKKLLTRINQLVHEIDLNIENLGYIKSEEVANLYSRATALIYPSLIESYGLPLIEAEKFGLPILASELDYVRDVCSPDETFNPYSAISIARAVKRFLKIPEEENKLFTAKEFIQHISKV